MTDRYEINFPTDNPLDPRHNDTLDMIVLNTPGMLHYVSNCASHVRNAEPKDQLAYATTLNHLIIALMRAFGRHAYRKDVPLPALAAFTDLLVSGMAIHVHPQAEPEKGNPTVEIEPEDFNLSMN